MGLYIWLNVCFETVTKMASCADIGTCCQVTLCAALLGIALREETAFMERVVGLLSISIILCCCVIQMPLLNANLLH